ncbi:MAG: metallophosphoesterase [Acetobacteraceae bacterium]|nr:metallophosphoesterase [Acetobacteraceae bacterium]
MDVQPNSSPLLHDWPPRLAPDARLRIVGDVHSDYAGFARAAETDRFLIQLGDLTDHGPDSLGVLRLMFRLIEERRGMFLLGNHDLKLAQALSGRAVKISPELERTLAALDAETARRAVFEIARAPAWLRWKNAVFVHAAFHTAMLDAPPELPNPVASGRVSKVLGRALYAEPTGNIRPDGFPERSLRWVDRIPAGITVYCGHDRLSRNGRPFIKNGRAGGTAVFLDTGAGKGGHLAWIDLPSETEP